MHIKMGNNWVFMVIIIPLCLREVVYSHFALNELPVLWATNYCMTNGDVHQEIFIAT
jgi:hypothetical protein